MSWLRALHELLVSFHVVVTVGQGLHPCPPGHGAVLLGKQESLRGLMGQWEGRLGPGRLTGAGFLCPQALRDAPILIFANKQDMKDSMTIVEISSSSP